MRFGLRWYWRRRPSRGEMPPPSNRTGFRPDAATTARAPRFSRQWNRSRGLRDWSARRAILIGTLSRAYHVVLQRNNGHAYRQLAVFNPAVFDRSGLARDGCRLTLRLARCVCSSLRASDRELHVG